MSFKVVFWFMVYSCEKIPDCMIASLQNTFKDTASTAYSFQSGNGQAKDETDAFLKMTPEKCKVIYPLCAPIMAPITFQCDVPN